MKKITKLSEVNDYLHGIDQSCLIQYRLTHSGLLRFASVYMKKRFGKEYCQFDFVSKGGTEDYYERELFIMLLRKIVKSSKIVKYVHFLPSFIATYLNIDPNSSGSDLYNLIDIGEFYRYRRDDFPLFCTDKDNDKVEDFFEKMERVIHQEGSSQYYIDRLGAAVSLARMIREGLEFNADKFETVKKDCQHWKHNIMVDYGIAEDNFEEEIKHRLGIDKIAKAQLMRKSFSSDEEMSLLAKRMLVLHQYQESIKALNGFYPFIYQGKIYPHYHLCGSATGRIACGKPNVLSMTPQMKKVLLGNSNGADVYEIDMSQAQLRILAALSGDEAMIEIFKKDQDIHVKTAVKILDRSTITDLERRKCKKINFGIIFGMTEYGIQRSLKNDYNIDEPLESCRQFIAEWFKLYSKVATYITTIISVASVRPFVVEAIGRRYDLRGSDNIAREAVNYPIQGIESAINCYVMQCLEDFPDVRVILNEHDGLTIKTGQSEEYVNHIVNIIAQQKIPLKFAFLGEVPIKFTIKKR